LLYRLAASNVPFLDETASPRNADWKWTSSWSLQSPKRQLANSAE
jgi:hypothetical protein